MNSQVRGIIWIVIFAAFIVTLIMWEDIGMAFPIITGIAFIAFSIYLSNVKAKAKEK